MIVAPIFPHNNEALKPDAGTPPEPTSAIKISTIAPAQLRAARSLLDWSRCDLSKKSDVSPETIKNIEHGTFSPKEETAKALIETFASYGVEFIRYESVVRLPADGRNTECRAAISYAGVVLVSSSIQKIREDGHD